MGTSVGFFFSRIALVASVLGIVLLGNLRSQASERPSLTHETAEFSMPDLSGSAAPRIAAERAPGGDLADVAAEDSAATDDDGRLVPAIYAWDPDVRFVYFRHVSKWM